MKSSSRKFLSRFAVASFGMYLMVSPLAMTVSASPANQHASSQNQNQTQTQNQNQTKTQNQNQKQSQKQDQKKKNTKQDKISKEDMSKRVKECSNRHKNDNNNLAPVQVVKSCAKELGLDANRDSFTLAKGNQRTAVVQVIHDENTYDVTLTCSNKGQWVVSSME